jgi:hypothetical protein
MSRGEEKVREIIYITKEAQQHNRPKSTTFLGLTFVPKKLEMWIISRVLAMESSRAWRGTGADGAAERGFSGAGECCWSG